MPKCLDITSWRAATREELLEYYGPGERKRKTGASAPGLAAYRKWQDDRGRASARDVEGVRVVFVIFDDATAFDGLFSQPRLLQHKVRLELGDVPQVFDVDHVFKPRWLRCGAVLMASRAALVRTPSEPVRAS